MWGFRGSTDSVAIHFFFLVKPALFSLIYELNCSPYTLHIFGTQAVPDGVHWHWCIMNHGTITKIVDYLLALDLLLRCVCSLLIHFQSVCRYSCVIIRNNIDGAILPGRTDYRMCWLPNTYRRTPRRSRFAYSRKDIWRIRPRLRLENDSCTL